MLFTQTPLAGAYVIDLELKNDDRGFFARTFCRNEFEKHGLTPAIAQANMAFSKRAGTVRGIHFQFPPSAEAKVVRCTRGGIVDVIVDLRPESPTFLGHFAVELNEENRVALYVPERFGHAYQVLRDNSEAIYQTSEFYSSDRESGLRYSDPRLGIKWPLSVTSISVKDEGWPLLAEREEEIRRRMSAVSKGDSR